MTINLGVWWLLISTGLTVLTIAADVVLWMVAMNGDWPAIEQAIDKVVETGRALKRQRGWFVRLAKPALVVVRTLTLYHVVRCLMAWASDTTLTGQIAEWAEDYDGCKERVS